MTRTSPDAPPEPLLLSPGGEPHAATAVHSRASRHVDRLRSVVDQFAEPGGPHVLLMDLVPDPDAKALDGSRLRPLLHETIAAVQRFVTSVEESTATKANIVFVIDADAAMGDSESLTEERYWEATLAGALLSMSRTLAIELVKGSHTVNTVLARTEWQTRLDNGIWQQIEVLLAQTQAIITGQQIFAVAGGDTGRLRP